MVYVFEGRVKTLSFDCNNGATPYQVSFDVYTSFFENGEKQYFAYEKSNSSTIDLFGASNIVECEIAKTNKASAKSSGIFDFISVHYRDLLKIEYKKDGNTRTITKVTLLND